MSLRSVGNADYRKAVLRAAFATLGGMNANTTPNAAAGELAGRHIVLGLSGGAACFKAAEFCRLLVKAGATVQVVMTEAACQFITPVAMQALSGRPVYVSQ